MTFSKNSKTMNKKKYNFITIFPEYFNNYFSLSIANKALKSDIIGYETVNIRDFSHKGKVDDYVYGGDKGMLMKIDCIYKSIEFIRKKNENTKIILLSPQGNKLDQEKIKELNEYENLTFICGRYEGIDARIKYYIDEAISIGDFICNGGEIPALIIIDSLIRTIPGVIKEHSYQNETFSSSQKKNFKECDLYTRPSTFDGHSVPEVLMSGNHKEIELWKIENSFKKN